MRRSMAELAASLQSATSENSPFVSLPLSFSSETADQPREHEIESGTLQQDRQLLATAATQDYRAKAFELMTANVKANLEYAAEEAEDTL
jgi:hypothetical protein